MINEDQQRYTSALLVLAYGSAVLMSVERLQLVPMLLFRQGYVWGDTGGRSGPLREALEGAS